MLRSAVIKGALLGGLAVALGAFGAHALKALLPADQLAVFETAVRYQFYHALALLLVGLLYAHHPTPKLRLAAHFFFAGTACFSGSLYGLVFLISRGIAPGAAGIITPIGGLLLLTGWALLVVGMLDKKPMG